MFEIEDKIMKVNFLTMNIYINAWLDCRHPFISIHNRFNDDLLVYFNEKEVNQLIANGEITIADLHSTDPNIQMEVITDLIAIKSSQKVQKQVSTLGTQLRKRQPTFLMQKKDVINKLKTNRMPVDIFSLLKPTVV